MAESQSINLRPDEFSEGGGLADDFDGVISDIRFISTDYDGSTTEQVPVCRVVFDVDGEEISELYSVGGKGDFAPDDNGTGLIKLQTKDKLTKTSKFGMLLTNLVDKGFPLNRMDGGDITYLVGLNAHWLREVVVFKGLKAKKEGRDSTVLLVSKINKLPWETAKGGKAKGKAKDAEDAGALGETLAGIIQDILQDKDGNVSKKDMLTVLFKHPDVVASADKKALLKLAKDDAYLGGRSEWSVEDGVLSA